MIVAQMLMTVVHTCVTELNMRGWVIADCGIQQPGRRGVSWRTRSSAAQPAPRKVACGAPRTSYACCGGTEAATV